VTKPKKIQDRIEWWASLPHHFIPWKKATDTQNGPIWAPERVWTH